MRSLILACVAVQLMACAGSIPLPSERLAQAESASRGAKEVGAEAEPTAALHLKMAYDQIGQAKKLIDKKDYAKADALLARAQSDADLSLELAKSAKARAAADEAIAHVKALQTAK